MIIDIIIAIVIAVWAVYGYRKGFVCQLFTLVGILIVTFFAVPIAEIAERILADECNIIIPSKHMELLLITATAASIYIIVYCIGRFFHNTLVKGIKFAEKTNHILGMVLAFFEASLAVYFFLCLSANYQDKIHKYTPECEQVLVESICYQNVKDFNLLAQYHYFTRNNTQSTKTEPSPEHPNPTSDQEQKP